MTHSNLMLETETRLFFLKTKLHFKTLCLKFQKEFTLIAADNL
jgi:hypothetical protein